VPFEELHIGPGHVHQGRIPGCSSAVSLDYREKILEMANERTSTLAEYCSKSHPSLWNFVADYRKGSMLPRYNLVR
jgi:hypothetical protein